MSKPFGLEHRAHYWPLWPALAGLALTCWMADYHGLSGLFNEQSLGNVLKALAGPLLATFVYLKLTGDRARCSTMLLAVLLGTAVAFVNWKPKYSSNDAAGTFWVMGYVLGYVCSRLQNRRAWKDEDDATGQPDSIALYSTKLGGDIGDFGSPSSGGGSVVAGYLGSAKLILEAPASWTAGRAVTAALIWPLAAWTVVLLGGLAKWRDGLYPMHEWWLVATLAAVAFGITEILLRLAYRVAKRQKSGLSTA